MLGRAPLIVTRLEGNPTALLRGRRAQPQKEYDCRADLVHDAPPTEIVGRQMRRNSGNRFAAPHNETRDNLATMSLYTKLAARQFATYGHGHQGSGNFKKMRSI